MPPHETPPAKASPASLPYEIFLNIIDVLITEAESYTAPNGWEIIYNHASPSRLVVVNPLLRTTRPPRRCPTQLSRFINTRLAAQINRRTRAMVHRKFQRFPCVDSDGNPAIDAWIRPTLDCFMPFFGSHLPEATTAGEEHHCRQAVLLPTPRAAVLLAIVRRVIITQGCYFCRHNVDSIVTMATLPNLDMLMMPAGKYFPRKQVRQPRGTIGPVDPEVFPDLAAWAAAHGPSFDEIYAPLKRRGIKLYGTTDNGDTPVVEILSEEGEIRLKFMMFLD